MSNQDAQMDCINDGLTGLATIEEDGEFELLRSFVGVLAQDNERLWLGYYYDTSGSPRLRGTGAESQSSVLEGQNFGAGESPADGVCITIGRDGRLYRMNCTEALPYACYRDLGNNIATTLCACYMYVCWKSVCWDIHLI